MPYITAATCLHMPAISGHEQVKPISAGCGKRPVSWLVITDMTSVERRPCSSSIIEPILPVQALQMACQRDDAAGRMSMATR